MSLSVSSRRVLRGAPALVTPSTTTTTTTTSTTTTASSLIPALQSLTLSPRNAASSAARPIHTTARNQWFWSKKSSSEPQGGGSALEKQVTGTRESRNKLISALTSRIQAPALFADEVKGTDKYVPTGPYSGSGGGAAHTRVGASLVREHMARHADPDPRSRVRWERKMVIRSLQRGTNPFSREPRAARIARTERQLTSKSPWLATSTKKLVHLARQIQGKTLEDALVQMRFSKKKYAQEVKYQLELARDIAIVERGMGLGSAKKAQEGGDNNNNNNNNNNNGGKVIEIQDKNGKWIKIDDPTRMYVAEAWVNRGPLRGTLPEFRARGRVNFQRLPSASISIVLKEEKTRIREAAEREARKLRQGPWVHLPDRPVSAQRQWYSW
ncbi:mitochondrial 54S ribosomal protein uL22m [Thermothelomyces heterothallicus CBS 202.75]|uniref:mitochondrial 54S ribosomal protein uL22m n=1 Tax=Thermothelomyces heterothallicus CBS 202.75 TaxID=1149848 RepID=UPI003742D483